MKYEIELNGEKKDMVEKERDRIKKEFDINVPGLEDLKKAKKNYYNEMERHRYEFDKMMYDGNNDGVNPPKSIDRSLESKYKELARKYPRAYVYLKADGYTLSNNVDKYSAGEKAMELIKSGGSISDAEDILKNWLPKEKVWT